MRAADREHRRPDRADRVGPGGQPGRRQAAHDGHRHRDGHRQQRPPRRGAQAQPGRHRQRDHCGQQPGGKPDPGQFAQYGGEQPRPAPAERGQHPQLAPPPAHRRGRGVADKQHAHHQDQREQHHARLIHRVQDRHRDALFHPAFRQGQRRLPELARGQADGHRRRRGTGHDVHIQAGALLDLLRDRVDALPRQRIRPGDARDPDPDHADRISGWHAGVDLAVLQRRQRRQRGDQVHRLADQATQVLAGQQVAPVQRLAAGRGRRRRDHRLVAAERHPRQRVERPDPGWIKHTSDLDQGVREPPGSAVCAVAFSVRGHRPVLAVLVVHGDRRTAAGVPDRRGVDRLTRCQRPGLGALVVHRADGPVAGDGSASEGRPVALAVAVGPSPLSTAS